MRKLLFIGAAVADIVLRVPALPAPGDDLVVEDERITLGGCALNACRAATLAETSRCVLFSPVGGGVWGNWVRQALKACGMTTAVPLVDDPNGCCYCLVTPDGERTFLCRQGAEYRFLPEWFDALTDPFDGAYVCGLEIELPTGSVILDWLERCPPKKLYFAPGPRLCRIHPEAMARIMALHPLFHLSQVEAAQFTQTDDIAEAAARIYALSGAPVIVTLGAEGAYVLDQSKGVIVPGAPVQVIDTIGAGDAHIGTFMAAEAEGLSAVEAVACANRVAAAVVGQAGAALSKERYQQVMGERKEKL